MYFTNNKDSAMVYMLSENDQTAYVTQSSYMLASSTQYSGLVAFVPVDGLYVILEFLQL